MIHVASGAFGSIHRFHGADHRPWSYDNHTEDVIRTYLKMRYAFMPSLIAAGQVRAVAVLWPCCVLFPCCGRAVAVC